MPSVSRHIARHAAIAACGLLLAGAAGCSTTQEKAERQQARAKHILDARKNAADGPKTALFERKSAHRHGKGE